MARRTTVQYFDDLDGARLEPPCTLTFELDGRGYEIDLSTENAERLRRAFEPFVSAARQVRRPRKR